MSEAAKTILLVGDLSDHADLVRRAFEGHEDRFDLALAAGLGEAREFLSRTGPDLVIVDLKLPDGSGLDLLEGNNGDHLFPVVVMTGQGDEEEAVRVIKAGALDYVVKSAEVFAALPRLAERALREWDHIRGRHQAEAALRESEERYRLLFNQSNDAIFVHGLDDDGRPGRFIEVNTVACERLGYSHDELLNLSPLDIGVETGVDEALAIGRKLLAEGRAEFETVHRTRDGRLIPVESNVRLFDFRNQRAVLSVSRDITDRHQAEVALRESEHRFRELVDHMSSGVAVYQVGEDGRDFIFQDFNQAAERITGVKKEDLLGRGVREVFPGVTDLGILEVFRRVFKTGRPESHPSARYSDQRLEFWVDNYVYRLPSGEIVAVFDDITDRKRAEEALRESEGRFRLLYEGAPLGYQSLDEKGNFLEVNQAWLETLGFSRNEVIGRNFGEFLPPEWVDHFRENFPRFKAMGEILGVEFEMVKKDGSRIMVAFDGKIGHDHSGQFKQTHCILHDITARKKAEEALRESERTLKTLMANLPGVAYRGRNDRDRTMLFASDGCRELTGYPPDDLVHNRRLTYTDLIDPEDRQAVWDQVQEAVSRQQPFTVMYRLHTAAGEIKWVWENGEGVFGEDGQLVALEGFVSDVTELRQAEDALRESEQRLKEAQKIGRIGHWEYDLEREEVFWSDQVFELFGRAPDLGPPIIEEESLGLEYPESAAQMRLAAQLAIEDGRRKELDVEVQLPDGVQTYLHTIITPQVDDSGRVTRLTGTIQDITARKRAEMEREEAEIQLLQAQKMEAMGRLAGGIAHDFNNLLTIITGFSDLVLERLSATDSLRPDMMEIRTAGQRAATLTRQLLAFSRRQVLEPRVIDVNSIVADVEKMLQRLIGEDIELVVAADPDVGAVKADSGQFEQVILNLAVNARDAMPRGGRLTVETANVFVDDSAVEEHAEMTPGHYVVLAISDTGVGMDKEVQSRIFEPFFTTKAIGQGTGLGLSTVYGIVRQSDGHLFVYSEPGQGSTFKIYLPRLDEAAEDNGPALEDEESLKGLETVLVVEDEEQVSELACRVLRRYDYQVLEAGGGEEAILAAEQHPGPIHLLITDVVMPQMSGSQVAERLERLRPDTKVLFMSGYTDDAIARHGVLHEGVNFISKPFSPRDLARKVRRILDG